MSTTRRFLVVLVLCGLTIGGFLAGFASAQQVHPREHVAQYQFPQAWGELKTVMPAAGGYAYFFEADDGSIRNVRIGPAGLEDIEVIRRSGAASRTRGPGSLR